MIAAAKVSFDLCNDMSGDKRTLKSFGLQMWATPFPCSALPHPPSSKRQWISDDLQLCVVRISKMNLWWDLNPMAIHAPFAVNYKAKYFLYYFCRCGLHASWFAEQLREFTIDIFFVFISSITFPVSINRTPRPATTSAATTRSLIPDTPTTGSTGDLIMSQ